MSVLPVVAGLPVVTVHGELAQSMPSIVLNARAPVTSTGYGGATKSSRLRVKRRRTVMRPSAANSSTVPSARYPTLVDTVIEAGLSVNADDATLRAPKESNAKAQIACRARVPTPRPWNPRPIHERFHRYDW